MAHKELVHGCVIRRSVPDALEFSAEPIIAVDVACNARRSLYDLAPPKSSEFSFEFPCLVEVNDDVPILGGGARFIELTNDEFYDFRAGLKERILAVITDPRRASAPPTRTGFPENREFPKKYYAAICETLRAYFVAGPFVSYSHFDAIDSSDSDLSASESKADQWGFVELEDQYFPREIWLEEGSHSIVARQEIRPASVTLGTLPGVYHVVVPGASKASFVFSSLHGVVSHFNADSAIISLADQPVRTRTVLNVTARFSTGKAARYRIDFHRTKAYAPSPPSTELPSIMSLSPELLLMIFDNLDRDSLLQARQVCRTWTQLCDDQKILMRLCSREPRDATIESELHSGNRLGFVTPVSVGSGTRAWKIHRELGALGNHSHHQEVVITSCSTVSSSKGTRHSAAASAINLESEGNPKVILELSEWIVFTAVEVEHAGGQTAVGLATEDVFFSVDETAMIHRLYDASERNSRVQVSIAPDLVAGRQLRVSFHNNFSFLAVKLRAFGVPVKYLSAELRSILQLRFADYAPRALESRANHESPRNSSMIMPSTRDVATEFTMVNLTSNGRPFGVQMDGVILACKDMFRKSRGETTCIMLGEHVVYSCEAGEARNEAGACTAWHDCENEIRGDATASNPRQNTWFGSWSIATIGREHLRGTLPEIVEQLEIVEKPLDARDLINLCFCACRSPSERHRYSGSSSTHHYDAYMVKIGRLTSAPILYFSSRKIFETVKDRLELRTVAQLGRKRSARAHPTVSLAKSLGK